MGAPLGIVRMGVDVCSGHDGFNPRPAITGSMTVFVDGIPLVRSTDAWGLHTDGMTVHQGQSAIGSMTVFADGLPVMRAMDTITCGSMCAMSSLTTFAG